VDALRLTILLTAVAAAALTACGGLGAAASSIVTVTVPDTAGITRTESASPGQLAVGQCVRANGQKDSAGTVKARVVSIVPAGLNGCPQGRPNSVSGA
jgi:hypothetical protein